MVDRGGPGNLLEARPRSEVVATTARRSASRVVPGVAVAAAVLVAVLAAPAAAADQAIGARRVVLDRAKGVIEFRSDDGSIPLPAPGSADDPAIAGLRIDLFVPSQAPIALDVPPGAPGWRARDGRLRFRNPEAPAGPSAVRALYLREGRKLLLRARIPGAPFEAPLGGLGVRLTWGQTRVCTYFGPTSIRVDGERRFRAREAPGDDLDDCSDATLDRTPCGVRAGFPACEGWCADGRVCGALNDVHTPWGGGSCSCVDPAQPCGLSGAYCEKPFACTLGGSALILCAPVFCASDAACGPWGCHESRILWTSGGPPLIEASFCAPNEACEPGSPGFACPLGEICEVLVDMSSGQEAGRTCVAP